MAGTTAPNPVPTDDDELVLNPITKKLDMVRNFNADRIVTATLNQAGQPRMTFDVASNSQIPDGPTVVIDNDGNVVTVG